jgi:hypothetical protein
VFKLADFKAKETVNYLTSSISALSFNSLVSNDSNNNKPASDFSGDDKKDVKTIPNSDSHILNMRINCGFCNQSPLNNNWCAHCKAFSVRCSVCDEGIKGAAIFCPNCLHGGHIDHVKLWFGNIEEIDCPTGCGCLCGDYFNISDQEIASDDYSDYSYDDRGRNTSIYTISDSSSDTVDEELSSEGDSQRINQKYKSAGKEINQQLPVHHRLFRMH